MLKITLPVAPSVNAYLGYKIVYINGRAIPRPFETKAAFEYKEYVKNIIHRELKKQAWTKPSENEYIIMDITYYFDRKHKDADNAIKVMQDAIVKSKIVPDDDIIIPKVKNIYIDRHNPRVDVELFISDKVGIFDNPQHLMLFKKDNCCECKKGAYKRPCGILKKALENRIEPEIDLIKMKCFEKKPV